MHFTQQRRSRAAQRGVTLIELMIGMLVGMLAMLVISQVLLTSESQKRTATGGADAQVNGALALYALQRDIETRRLRHRQQPEHHRLPDQRAFNGAAPTGFPARLAPVVITPQASRPPAASATRSASWPARPTSCAVPTRVIAAGLRSAARPSNVRSTIGFSQGDLALVGDRRHPALLGVPGQRRADGHERCRATTAPPGTPPASRPGLQRRRA